MAAVIARISRQNRERKLRLKSELPPSKSNYVLAPFSRNFEPSRDNKVRIYNNYQIIYKSTRKVRIIVPLQYFLRRKSISHKQNFKSRLDKIIADEKVRLTSVPQTPLTAICDYIIIAVSLSLVPILVIIILIIWPV